MIKEIKPFLIVLPIVLGFFWATQASAFSLADIFSWYGKSSSESQALGAPSLTYLGNASSTAFSANVICLTADTCRTTWPSSSATFPFTPTSYGVSTSTTIGLLNGFLSTASSTVDASLLITGNLRMANSSFLGFAGSTAVDSTNYSLFGNTTLTLLNARSGASIGFRINNADVANFTTTGGFGFGNTYYNIDPGQNNMIVEGNLGVGISAPTQRLHVSGNLLVTGNATATNATTSSLAISSLVSTLLKTNANGSIVPAILGTDYIDRAEQNYKESAEYATTAALPTVIYDNGSSGVGATLTAVSVGAISIDGSSPSVGERILVKNQVTTAHNGIYTVTVTGSGIAVFVLTRTTDFDQAADILSGDALFVANGSTQSATTWAYTGIDSPTMGTSAITFVQVAGQGSFTGGTGITITGTSIAVDQTFSPTWTGAHIFNNITRSTTTSATSTNSFSTNASSTNLWASAVNFGSSILSIVGNTLTGLGVWDFGGATSVEIPNAAAPTVDATGEIAIDTTSGQLKYYDGRVTHIITGTSSPAFNIASTTMDANGKGFGTATSSFTLKNDPEPRTLLGFYCKATSTAATTNTALVRFGDGTNWTAAASCSTTGAFTNTNSNNTFTAFEDFIIQASSTAGALDRLTITTIFNKTAD